MGATLSNIAAVDKLQKLNADNLDVRRVFERFNLTVIILCNKDDSDFFDELNRGFNVLNNITGEHLLFLTFSSCS